MTNLIGHDSATASRKAWILSIVVRSQKLWGAKHPHRHQRHQWVRKTIDLTDRGVHLAQIGRFRYKL